MRRNNLDLSNMAAKLATSKWMLLPSAHTAMCNSVDAYMKGELSYSPMDDPEEPEEDDGTYPISILGVSGVLSKGVSELEAALLGLVDVDDIAKSLDEAAADPTVDKIVLAFSSPGGETVGIEELGRKIKYIDENVKPIYGWTESIAASAALWLISNCRKVGMTPSAQIGGCGVYSLVLNTVAQMASQGVAIEVFASGKYKMMGHDFRNLTDEERKLLQADVDRQHEQFKSVVMAKRPQVSKDDLEGLTYEGRDALAKGFVDSLYDDFGEFLVETTK